MLEIPKWTYVPGIDIRPLARICFGLHAERYGAIAALVYAALSSPRIHGDIPVSNI